MLAPSLISFHHLNSSTPFLVFILFSLLSMSLYFQPVQTQSDFIKLAYNTILFILSFLSLSSCPFLFHSLLLLFYPSCLPRGIVISILIRVIIFISFIAINILFIFLFHIFFYQFYSNDRIFSFIFFFVTAINMVVVIFALLTIRSTLLVIDFSPVLINVNLSIQYIC